MTDIGGVAIVDRALAKPAIEDGPCRQFQLLIGILRELSIR